MLFPTVEFGLFFVSVLLIAWSLHRFNGLHKFFLLLASYIFYGFWNWRYVPLLFGISLFSGLIAQRIQASESQTHRKAWLLSGVVVCLATLGYYKYTSFFFSIVLEVWARVVRPPVIPIPSPLLPLGVSFFVFHAISLMMDAYRGKLKQAVRLGDALLYVAFFPQLIAGPILRASSFIPQLTSPRDPARIRINRAFLLIISGLFKKVVISNLLATRLVDGVFAAPETFNRGDILLAIYGYAAQIYCDFSGYTDIAIGCAMLLGYRFPRNFNSPYTATNPQDFWRRWHISLSSWLRDYLYIPLGGSRGSALRTSSNLMITMLLGGLWHGAGWTFVMWGALHGFYLIVHRIWNAVPWTPLVRMRAISAWRWVARLLLFHGVCLGWVFFRAPSFAVAFALLHRLTIPGAVTLATVPVMLALILGLAGQYQPLRWRKILEREVGCWPALARGAAFAIAIFVVELLGPSGVAPFIYFRF
ncbi:MAG: MBOAT family protein [Terracidiphilus sp.]|jgi:D-alanyl-lipoteichoic acid acyltransferase DltB (MBOAT superfamily)